MITTSMYVYKLIHNDVTTQAMGWHVLCMYTMNVILECLNLTHLRAKFQSFQKHKYNSIELYIHNTTKLGHNLLYPY